MNQQEAFGKVMEIFTCLKKMVRGEHPQDEGLFISLSINQPVADEATPPVYIFHTIPCFSRPQTNTRAVEFQLPTINNTIGVMFHSVYYRALMNQIGAVVAYDLDADSNDLAEVIYNHIFLDQQPY